MHNSSSLRSRLLKRSSGSTIGDELPTFLRTQAESGQASIVVPCPMPCASGMRTGGAPPTTASWKDPRTALTVAVLPCFGYDAHVRSRLLAGFISFGLLTAPRIGQTSPTEEATAYKTLAKAAFKAGRYAECAKQFAASHALVPDPNNLFNIGLCFDKQGDAAQSLSAFRSYLNAAPQGDRASEAKTRIELLEMKLKVATAKDAKAQPTVRAHTAEQSPETSTQPTPKATSRATSPEPTAVPARSVLELEQARRLDTTSPNVAASSPTLSAGQRSHHVAFQMGVALGLMGDGTGSGTGVSFRPVAVQLWEGEPRPTLAFTWDWALRIGFASMDAEDYDSFFYQFGIEMRAGMLLLERVQLSLGVTGGLSDYSQEDLSLEEPKSSSFGGNLQLDPRLQVILGDYAIGASYVLNIPDVVHGVNLTLSRYWYY